MCDKGFKIMRHVVTSKDEKNKKTETAKFGRGERSVIRLTVSNLKFPVLEGCGNCGIYLLMCGTSSVERCSISRLLFLS